ncbi:MAG: DUF499 domain-containing protein [Myxococcaceae bacterium]|nr:MAG: DUF499 domain-containing protein [Myxococcaceae bacterium]
MSVPTIFDLCTPRADVLAGNIRESDFAADLAQVLRGDAPDEYRIPARFFANTHPTRGLKNLLRNVLLRLGGRGGEVAPIFRLDTQYGGGKTHALIALAHAARGMEGVGNVAEFVDPELVPRTPVRIAMFDGENADPSNGRLLGDGVRARTPWGELAFQLGQRDGFEKVRRSDEEGVAPGADTLRELFGASPTLVLLDELSVYLRKVRRGSQAADQLTAFLTGLFKAVEGTPNAALVFTLAIGKAGKATDAYSEENQQIAGWFIEAESVAARKATVLDPTSEDETAQVLRRRLFDRIDDTRVPDVVEAYTALWTHERESLPAQRVHEDRAEDLRRGYPLHPALMDVLTAKLSTLGNFQRVRGMLRLLARTVACTWARRPADAHALHTHHVDPGDESIHGELVTRLQMGALKPALQYDVASGAEGGVSTAQNIDAEHYVGLPPYAAYVARTILLNTLAFNEALQGLTPPELRYSMLSPGLNVSYVEDARTRFLAESSYRDDRPGAPMRFLAEANLTQIIKREEKNVDEGVRRDDLNDRIREIFKGAAFALVPFAASPGDVPDEIGDNKPFLVLIGYDADAVHGNTVAVPSLVEKIYRYHGAAGTSYRKLSNNLVFVVADDSWREEMKDRMSTRLALREIVKLKLSQLAEHQRAEVREREKRAESAVAIAIQQCYRHVFYPSKTRLDGADVDLAHTAIDAPSAAAKPGDGQAQVVRKLREQNKLRLAEDAPDSPSFVRDRTLLRKAPVSTFALRHEFRCNPVLPILVGDEVFLRGIRQAVEAGEYVYQRGDLVCGKGDPFAQVLIDEAGQIYTAEQAGEKGVWPRPAPKPPTTAPAEPPLTSGQPVTYRTPSGTQKAVAGARPPRPEPDTLRAEGPLREALTRIWEQARGKKHKTLARLSLKLTDAGDAFKLMGVINTVADAEKLVEATVGYQTADQSETQLTFTGSLAEALPVKDFLDPQLRAAKDRDFSLTFTLTFKGGLVLDGDAPEKLAEKLTRFATGAAYVEAHAEVPR